jgi:hypothetical protein
VFFIFIGVVYFHRSLYLGSVAEKRGRAIHISDLEELLGGCSQLEVRHTNNNKLTKITCLLDVLTKV